MSSDVEITSASAMPIETPSTLRDALGQRVLVLTHEFVRGAPQELVDYLRALRTPLVVAISNPLLEGSDLPAHLEHYVDGVEVRRKERREPRWPPPLRYMLHVWRGVAGGWSANQRFDTMVCADPLNMIAGVVLHLLRRGDRIVYYTIDFVPRRFESRALNWLYHRIDRWAVRRADIVWNVSARIEEARAGGRGHATARTRQLVVPIGIHPPVGATPEQCTEPRRLAFIGHLVEKQGLELVLRALPAVRAAVPGTSLLVVGDGDDRVRLEALARDLGLEEAVEFTGLIRDRATWEPMLARCGLGLAPYLPDPESFTYYADPTKPKDYLGLGLPVLLTDVPHYAHEVERAGAGIVVEPTPEAIADAVVAVIADPPRRDEMARRATALAATFTWQDIFERAGAATVGTWREHGRLE